MIFKKELKIGKANITSRHFDNIVLNSLSGTRHYATGPT
jgi:hypothetical protein